MSPASDALRADHRIIEQHLDRLFAAASSLIPERVPELSQIFADLRRLAAPHFEKEETVFYPRLRPALPELLARMDEQHAYTREMEQYLADQLASGALDHRALVELERLAIEFHDSIQHHIVEEEDQLLRLADQTLGEAEQQALLTEMRKIPAPPLAGNFSTLPASNGA